MSKEEIIKGFILNVKGRKFDPYDDAYELDHDGAEGHWLERSMGVKANCDNAPDLPGFEMKADTGSKTTFGDWSPDFAIWKKGIPGGPSPISRDDFLSYFGKYNISEGYFSWSGEPVPKVNIFNRFGQTLYVDENQNIIAYYCYSEDRRAERDAIVPVLLRKEGLILALWSKENLKEKVENKFNQEGWFKCYKDSDGFYTGIGFGYPINYDLWIDCVKKGIVFFDSGMHQGQSRPRSNWRANNQFWESLIYERH